MLRVNTLAVNNSDFMSDECQIDDPIADDAHRILLIEDNRSDVFLIKKMLGETSRYNKFVFTDVPRMGDALELIDNNDPFDLILLDLNLLDIEGCATVSALNAEAPNVPIVVYSGTNDPRLKEEALMCGAKHYLVKGRESPYSLNFVIKEALSYAQL